MTGLGCKKNCPPKNLTLYNSRACIGKWSTKMKYIMNKILTFGNILVLFLMCTICVVLFNMKSISSKLFHKLSSWRTSEVHESNSQAILKLYAYMESELWPKYPLGLNYFEYLLHYCQNGQMSNFNQITPLWLLFPARNLFL